MRDEGQELSPPASRAELVAALEQLHAENEQLRRENHQLVEAQRQVEEERDLYLSAYDGSPTASLVMDGNGVVRLCNAAAATLLGLSKAQLVGRSIDLFLQEPAHALFFR